MTEPKKENTHAGFPGIPLWGSDGIAGLSPEVSQCDENKPGADDAGLEFGRRGMFPRTGSNNPVPSEANGGDA